MVIELQKIQLRFYENSGGNEPVRDWLKAQDGLERQLLAWT
ncbi:MAG: hypothetical protein ACYCSS_07435 [Sulfuriferula sp.]